MSQQQCKCYSFPRKLLQSSSLLRIPVILNEDQGHLKRYQIHQLMPMTITVIHSSFSHSPTLKMFAKAECSLNGVELHFA